ncbi:MAG: hypothetical protein JXA03_12030 [Bacteroidales bacterium]|nr:hypothetical protein [Bacteroidales bacterium]
MFLAGNEINLYPRATELTKERLKDINRKRKGKIRFSISFKRDENGKEDAISVDFLIPTSRKNTFKDINSF